MSAVLGLDFGEKRIGVAVSDETGLIAEPLKVLEFRGREALLREVKHLAEEYRSRQIVVGFPKTMKNEIGPAAEKIQAQVEWFKAQTDFEWILWDERLTTAEAERILLAADLGRLRRKDVRDKLAAQRILQSYLDSKK